MAHCSTGLVRFELWVLYDMEKELIKMLEKGIQFITLKTSPFSMSYLLIREKQDPESVLFRQLCLFHVELALTRLILVERFAFVWATKLLTYD